MAAERGISGFYGDNDYYKSNHYNRRNYDYGSRYFGNEIDRDVYYEKRSRDYYPNYNPEGSASNRRGKK
jgi:hypothetical protein